MERTFVAIKPNGVKRGLVGRILSRFEDKGYRIIAMKIIHVDNELASKHYAEHKGKPFYNGLVEYITSSPIAAIVLEGENVVEQVRRLMGATDPNKADVGTIRADFAQAMERNIVHGSDSVESAKREIALYFSENEICEY